MQAVGLVLSGGGARCFSHIGAMKALEEQGVRVSAIAASSSGAVLGALFAAGNGADTVYELAKQLDYKRFFLSRGSGGLIGHSGIEELLEGHLPPAFEQLTIPLAVTAVDIQNGELLVLRTGPLVPAVCASNAFPGLFEPQHFEGRFLMDGGILNNFPVDLIRNLTTDPVLALDATLSPKQTLNLDGENPKPGFIERLASTLKGEGLPTPLLVDILMKAYTITQSRLIKVMTAMHPPDHMVRAELPEDFGIESFGRLEEAYQLGYRATQQFLQRNPL